jgi:hypothetical protein
MNDQCTPTMKVGGSMILFSNNSNNIPNQYYIGFLESIRIFYRLQFVIIYKCLTEFKPGDRVAIVSGVRLETVCDLIRRLKLLLLRNFPAVYSELAKQKDTEAVIGGVIITGYPVHSDTIRGIDKLRLAWIDEADSWVSAAESKNIRGVIEGFVAKPGSENMYVVWSSTVRNSHGLLWELEHEKSDLYYRMVLDYRWGLECNTPIYDKEQLDQARKSPEWGREYECKYETNLNGCFTQNSVDRAVELGNRYPVTINKWSQHSCGIDSGFGSSSCAFCVLEHSDGIIKVVYAEQFERSSFNDMIQKVWEIQNMVGGKQALDNIYCDSANPEFIEAVKLELGEDSNWSRVHEKIAHCRREGLNVSDYMRVVPVSFAQEGASMLAHCKNLLEHEDNLIAINPKWDKLIVALRGAIAREYKLDKTELPYNDLTDSFRLAAKFFKLQK